MVNFDQRNVQIVEMLLHAGANATIRNYNDQTASSIAYNQGFDDLAQVIGEHGLCSEMAHRNIPAVLDCVHSLGQANVQCDDIGMYTPLIVAVKLSDHAAVLELLRMGANPSLAEGDGWSPIMFAAVRKDLQVIRLLLRAGADRDAVTRFNMTVWDLVRDKEGFEEVVDLLRMQGQELGENIEPISLMQQQDEGAASIACDGDKTHKTADSSNGNVGGEGGVRGGQLKVVSKPSLWNLFGLF